MGLFSGNPFKRIGRAFSDATRSLGRLGGNDKYGNFSAWGMAPSDKSAGIEAGKAASEAAAAEKQALFEATTRAGLERLALKRKKGFGASMIVNPVLGSQTTLGG
ncbi:MAG: hypothetical protein HW377_1351 [Actinobacteria bacterium]|nr:hypothetical protein [Actinomycetota bacterium]MBM2827733.1 hypothetical protein [Actinomycetota bacterium]